MLSFDRLTVKVGEALQGAAQEARTREAPEVDGAHLLHVLLHQEEVIRVQKPGAAVPGVRERVEATLDTRARVSGGSEPTLSRDLNTALDEAEKQAQALGDEYVSTEHFLLGPTVEKGDAGEALREAGVTQERVLEALDAVRGGHRVTDQNSEDKYQALERYSRDLTALARQGKLDPVIGRDEEVRRIMKVLARRTKNNPVLIGEPRVGKTAIAEGPAQRIVNGDVPTSLTDKRLLALDISAMVAGAKYRGEFEE
jgi:ATP-dependent Clp protease ATP-binding subunit ClpB